MVTQFQQLNRQCPSPASVRPDFWAGHREADQGHSDLRAGFKQIGQPLQFGYSVTARFLDRSGENGIDYRLAILHGASGERYLITFHLDAANRAYALHVLAAALKQMISTPMGWRRHDAKAFFAAHGAGVCKGSFDMSRQALARVVTKAAGETVEDFVVYFGNWAGEAFGVTKERSH